MGTNLWFNDMGNGKTGHVTQYCKYGAQNKCQPHSKIGMSHIKLTRRTLSTTPTLLLGLGLSVQCRLNELRVFFSLLSGCNKLKIKLVHQKQTAR